MMRLIGRLRGWLRAVRLGNRCALLEFDSQRIWVDGSEGGFGAVFSREAVWGQGQDEVKE